MLVLITQNRIGEFELPTEITMATRELPAFERSLNQERTWSGCHGLGTI